VRLLYSQRILHGSKLLFVGFALTLFCSSGMLLSANLSLSAAYELQIHSV
jgi:hypothetical protein